MPPDHSTSKPDSPTPLGHGRLRRVLAADLDFTNEELKVSQEELKSLNAALEKKVDELERAELALRDADRRKDDFLAVLSRERRNPLAPIRNGLHVLEKAPAGGAAATRAREIMARQVEHLARLVDDLLDATRFAHGKLQVERRLVDLGTITRRTAEDHESLFAAREVAFTTALPAGPAWVLGDATRLAQLTGNLLQNAAKFSSGGDSVLLSLDLVEGTAVLRVRDTGIGIDPEVLPRLFQPFSQADGALDRRAAGLGLGLALVKGLVEAHGGTVVASSAGKGAGAEVVVRLPLAEPPTAPSELPRPPSPRARRVLVIEDNVDAADGLRLALELEGHDVAVAHSGAAGLERAREALARRRAVRPRTPADERLRGRQGAARRARDPRRVPRRAERLRSPGRPAALRGGGVRRPRDQARDHAAARGGPRARPDARQGLD